MPDFHVIENVSETIASVVTKALRALSPADPGAAPIAQLHDLHSVPSPPAGRSGVVTLTLVEVREDAASRNRPRTRNNAAERSLSTKPPVPLVLRYLLTPWSRIQDGVTNEERLLEQRMLGRVIQTLYDDAILSGRDLVGKGEPDPSANGAHFGLEGSFESLKVKLALLSFEEQTRFWHAVQQKYRPSLTYDIRVVNLDPIVELSEAMVSSREIQYEVLGKP
jgi:hypothetical protein